MDLDVGEIGYRVKSSKFGQTVKFGQPPCLFQSSIIGIKNKLTKQTVKILMRRLIRSRLILISTVCKRVSEFTLCPNLPDVIIYVCVACKAWSTHRDHDSVGEVVGVSVVRAKHLWFLLKGVHLFHSKLLNGRASLNTGQI